MRSTATHCASSGRPEVACEVPVERLQSGFADAHPVVVRVDVLGIELAPDIKESTGEEFPGLIGDRLAVYYSYSADLGNGWEDPAVHKDPPELHEAALRMGVNLFVYAVTSRPVP